MKTEKALAVLWRILQILILVIVGIVLLANLYRLAAREIFKVNASTVFGYSSAVVLTGSMSGTIGCMARMKSFLISFATFFTVIPPFQDGP